MGYRNKAIPFNFRAEGKVLKYISLWIEENLGKFCNMGMRTVYP
jgi:hypothetical protein